MLNFKVLVFIAVVTTFFLEISSRLFVAAYIDRQIEKVTPQYTKSPIDTQGFNIDPSRGFRLPHPYFGYISEYNSFENSNLYYRRVDKSKSNHLAIFGGSVAQAIFFSDIKQNILSRKWQVTSFSDGGYKQPQSFIISSLYKHTFNVAVNIEGYNELSQGAPGLLPYYPMISVAGVYFKNSETGYPDLRILDLAIQRRYLTNKIESNPQPFLHLPLAFNKVRLLYTTRKLYAATIEVTRSHSKKAFSEMPTDSVMLGKLKVWLDSSCSQQNLLKNNDIPYVSFIHPLPTLSKRNSAQEELMIAKYLKQNKQHSKVANVLKDLNFEEIRRKSGLNIHSLLNIFEDVEETMYIDGCCHLNESGMTTVLKEISSRVSELTNSKLSLECNPLEIEKYLTRWKKSHL